MDLCLNLAAGALLLLAMRAALFSGYAAAAAPWLAAGLVAHLAHLAPLATIVRPVPDCRPAADSG